MEYYEDDLVLVDAEFYFQKGAIYADTVWRDGSKYFDTSEEIDLDLLEGFQKEMIARNENAYLAYTLENWLWDYVESGRGQCPEPYENEHYDEEDR